MFVVLFLVVYLLRFILNGQKQCVYRSREHHFVVSWMSKPVGGSGREEINAVKQSWISTILMFTSVQKMNDSVVQLRVQYLLKGQNVCLCKWYFPSFKLFWFCLLDIFAGWLVLCVCFCLLHSLLSFSLLFLTPFFFRVGKNEIIWSRLNINFLLFIVYFYFYSYYGLFSILLPVPPVTGCQSWCVCVQVLHAMVWRMDSVIQ